MFLYQGGTIVNVLRLTAQLSCQSRFAIFDENPMPLSMTTRRSVTAGLAASLISFKVKAEPDLVKQGKAVEGGMQLEAGPFAFSVVPDKSSPGLGFNGQIPALIRLKLGEELHLVIKNNVQHPLSFHFYGMRSPNAFDGVGGLTQKPILPGEVATIRFTPPDAGFFLMRSLMPGFAAETSERGLQAVVIVEEKLPPAVDQDFALVIDDWKLEGDGSFSPFDNLVEKASLGRLGNILTVNAKIVPHQIEIRPGSRIRLRLASSANARSYRLRFDNLRPFVAAVDSQPTDKFEPLRSTLPFAPGSRYDLFLDVPREEGVSGSVMAALGQGMPLVTFVTKGEALPERASLAQSETLPENQNLPAIIRLQDSVRKDMMIDGGAGRSDAGELSYKGDPARIWTLNGQVGDAKKPLFTVKRKTPVVLSLANKTSYLQPFHLHGHCFRLLHGMDDGWEPYWLDTVQVPEGQTMRLAFIADQPGKWVIGSSVLERFDAGLWGWFEVL
jgi:FtsP/CotA-like multicopper oxidase with cupredoxin domain